MRPKRSWIAILSLATCVGAVQAQVPTPQVGLAGLPTQSYVPFGSPITLQVETTGVTNVAQAAIYQTIASGLVIRTVLLAQATNPPFTFTFTNLQTGYYTLFARVTDTQGGQVRSTNTLNCVVYKAGLIQPSLSADGQTLVFQAVGAEPPEVHAYLESSPDLINWAPVDPGDPTASSVPFDPAAPPLFFRFRLEFVQVNP